MSNLVGQVVRDPVEDVACHIFTASANRDEYESFWLRRIFVPATPGVDYRLRRRLFGRVWRGTKRLAARLISKSATASDPPGGRLSASEAMMLAPLPVTLHLPQGTETLNLAHNRVVFLCGVDGPCDPDLNPAIAETIAKSLRDALSGYFDESSGFRVCCLTSSKLKRHEIRMYVGRGAFAPRGGERPIGWLRLTPDADAATGVTLEPLLGDPDAADESLRPAGIYRGQSGLSFGAEPGRLPAFLAFGFPMAEPDLTFTLQPRAAADATETDFVNLRFANRSGVRVRMQRTSAFPDEVDQSWILRFSGITKQPARLDLSLDARAGRLHLRPPHTPHMAIVALRVGHELTRGECRRVWFNLDSNNRLIASPLRSRFSSLVYNIDSGVRWLYNWVEFDDAPRVGRESFRERTTGTGEVEIYRRDGMDLGYLALPATERPVLFSDPTAAADAYLLDWLDEVGAVERFGERGRIGLAQFYSELDSFETVPAVPSKRRASGGCSPRFTLGPLVLEHRSPAPRAATATPGGAA